MLFEILIAILLLARHYIFLPEAIFQVVSRNNNISTESTGEKS